MELKLIDNYLFLELDYLATHTSISPIRRGFAPSFVNYKKGALDSQPQVIKLTSCLPMVGELIKHFITMLCYHKLDTGSVETAQGCNILMFTQT
jgi:hypothetical protein